MNHTAITSAVEEIQTIVDKHSGRRPNADALAQIRAQTEIIRRAADWGGYFNGKCGEIEDYAEALYSAAKHRHYDSPGLSGVEQLKQLIIRESNSIAAQSSTFERISKESQS